MTSSCDHPLCALIGGSCSLATGRSRGCTSGFGAKQVAPELFDEVRRLVRVIRDDDRGARAAAIRLAEIVRSEARNDRQLVALARDEDEELATELANLCLRRVR